MAHQLSKCNCPVLGFWWNYYKAIQCFWYSPFKSMENDSHCVDGYAPSKSFFQDFLLFFFFFPLQVTKLQMRKKDSHYASIQSRDWPKKQWFQSFCSLKDLGSRGFNCVIYHDAFLSLEILAYGKRMVEHVNPTIVIKHDQVSGIPLVH